MRWELIWKPSIAFERLAYKARQRRRLNRLRNTVGRSLEVGHIESLELLEAARPFDIRTIYDVGASKGTWAMLAKAIIPEATVDAFEPLGAHCAAFHKNLLGAEGVRLHSVALGETSASATLRVTDFSDASSLLPLVDSSRLRFGVKEVEQVSVEVRRLDDFRIDHGLPLPDLLKLDVQGFELEVLKGATECLRTAKAVIVEVSFAEYYQRQCLFHEVVALLAEFDLFLTVLGVHTPTGVALKQTDVLFTRHR
jgi:FkbM family methyltransferase